MIARYRSICQRCRRRIKPGQAIVHLGPGQSIHKEYCSSGKSSRTRSAAAGNVASNPSPPGREISPRVAAALEAAERAGFR